MDWTLPTAVFVWLAGGCAFERNGGGGQTEAGEEALATLVLNEVMAANDSTVEDEFGEEDDWAEQILNRSNAAVPLVDWGLGTGDVQIPTFRFGPGGEIAAGDRVLVWLDASPDQGEWHAPFSLPREGGQLVLFDPAGHVVDAQSIPALAADVAWGRFPDGGATVAPTVHATPRGSNPASPGSSLDPSDTMFPAGEVLDIALTLPEASIQALELDPDTYVEGSIEFAGVVLGPVGIRLKGGNGSFRTLDEKAAFKVLMGWAGGNTRLRGLEKLTFNNMVEDPSLVHEMLAYTLFRDAGVPAPRAAYVSLSLNGEDRGVYLSVESADEHFLQRWFTNAEGNLYEGGPNVDFTDPSYHRMELDEAGSADADDYSDVARVVALIEQPADEAQVAAFEGIVDVDEFLGMWANEVLLGHWDGYFWFPHNYRVYHDPDSDRLSMLPWGTDNTFEEVLPIFEGRGAVASWALEIPSIHARFLTALDEAADQMDALGLADEAATLNTLVRPLYAVDPYAESTLEESDEALSSTQAFVSAWPSAVRDGVESGADPGADGAW